MADNHEKSEEQKAAEQQLTNALANFAQTSEGTPEHERAKDERAEAELKIAKARDSKNK